MEYVEHRGDYCFFFNSENMGTKKYTKYRCVCGEIGEIRNDNIKVSYQCKHPRKYIGTTIGRWTVIDIDKRSDGCSLLVCQCSCEKKTVRKIPMSALLHNKTMSCGCEHYETMKKKNEYIINEHVSEIHIGDKIVLFDTDDFNRINQYCWCINGTGYVIAWDSESNKMISLARLVMNAQVDEIVDHIDGNTLKNTRNNLRVVDYERNNMNQKKSRNNTSGHKGVHWHKGVNKWIANIGLNGKLIHLGYYVNYDDAVKTRKDAEKYYYGEYSREYGRESR